MMFASATSAMLVILCIMKYHSVLPEAMFRRSPIQDFSENKENVVCQLFVLLRGTFASGLTKLTGWCSFDKDKCLFVLITICPLVRFFRAKRSSVNSIC